MPDPQDLQDISGLPQQLGQALQNQQQPPAEQSDPIEQQLIQQYQQTQPRAPVGGRVQRLLGNFFSGGAEALSVHLGMPTMQQQQNQAFQRLNTWQQTKSLESMRAMQEQHLAMQDQILQKSLENQSRTAITTEHPLGKAYPSLVGSYLTPEQIVGFQKQLTTAQGPVLSQVQAEAIGHPELANQPFGSAISGIIGKREAANAKPNQFQLIARANKGDQDAQAILAAKQKMDMDLVKARGMAFGQGRLWSLQKVYDPDTGQGQFMTGFGILQAQQAGRNLTPMGGLSSKDLIGIQQLQAESLPALQNFSKPISREQAVALGDARAEGLSPLSAFDNPQDRAIFARVMKGSGEPVVGDEASWLGGIFNQAAKENLSPAGKLLATQYGPRLAETMGRMRSVLGLQATDQAMGLTMRLLPGGSTPNSAVARGQLNQIHEMIQQATGIPIYGGGVAAGRSSGNAPPRPAHVPIGYVYKANGPKGKGWYKP